MARKNGNVRTYPIKNLVIFLSVAFLVSSGMIVLMAFLQDEMMVIRVLVWILCGAFVLASGFMLCQQLLFYIEVDDQHFIKHIMFSKIKIPYKSINRVRNEDGFYVVYVKDKKIASFATNTPESQQIILIMEQKGVKIDW